MTHGKMKQDTEVGTVSIDLTKLQSHAETSDWYDGPPLRAPSSPEGLTPSRGGYRGCRRRTEPLWDDA